MSELLEALSHEGEKDRQIEQLLTYLHYDETTQSHRDWVADCQTYEARIAQLEAALREVVDFMKYRCIGTGVSADGARHDLVAKYLSVETIPAGYRDIGDIVADAEKDPRKKALLDAARAKLQSETSVDPLEGETKAATSRRAHGTEDAGSPPPTAETSEKLCPTCGRIKIEWGTCSNSFHIPNYF